MTSITLMPTAVPNRPKATPKSTSVVARPSVKAARPEVRFNGLRPRHGIMAAMALVAGLLTGCGEKSPQETSKSCKNQYAQTVAALRTQNLLADGITIPCVHPDHLQMSQVNIPYPPQPGSPFATETNRPLMEEWTVLLPHLAKCAQQYRDMWVALRSNGMLSEGSSIACSAKPDGNFHGRTLVNVPVPPPPGSVFEQAIIGPPARR